MASLGEKRLFLLDMDGTIYLDEDLFPGTLPFLEAWTPTSRSWAAWASLPCGRTF